MTRLEQLAAAQSEFLAYVERCESTGDRPTIAGFSAWLSENVLVELESAEPEPTRFWYELRFRPLGPKCQPPGFIDHDQSRGRHGLVAYSQPLSPAEIDEYELRAWSE